MNIRTSSWRLAPSLSILALFASFSPADASIIFENRPPGNVGGGQSIGDNFPGHTFRLHERTEVSALGAYVSAFSDQSVFAALYRVATPDTLPDVINESNFLGATLLNVGASAGVPSDVSGPISLMLEPGWYSILTGRGRHGATAFQFGVSLNNTGTAAHPDSWGNAYTINPATNARVLSSATTRYFVEGGVLPPAPTDPYAFKFETARSHARWSSSSFFINDSTFWGTRFDITETTFIDEASSWLRSGNGSIFYAIVELSSPGANPPLPTDPGFASSVVASALVDVGAGSDEYAADFGGLELAPGSYALVLGTGLFGATGSANIMEVSDQILPSESLNWFGTNWSSGPPINYRFAISGTIIPTPGAAALAIIAFSMTRRRPTRG
ncbi:MAG: hypothetical protein EA376_06225 [Phycisphaeraceae bacterium]|nr:MAG: hypothetical protein EA376_06225 [Phycisphaeraceae bacterium]